MEIVIILMVNVIKIVMVIAFVAVKMDILVKIVKPHLQHVTVVHVQTVSHVKTEEHVLLVLVFVYVNVLMGIQDLIVKILRHNVEWALHVFLAQETVGLMEIALREITVNVHVYVKTVILVLIVNILLLHLLNVLLVQHAR
jgi:hypothetical protein